MEVDKMPPEVAESIAKADDFCASYKHGFETHNAWATIRAHLRRLAEENARLRETVKRLNRRVQVAEAGVAEKVKASAPGSLGRALANAAADMLANERDEALAELAAIRKRIAEAPKTSAYADGDDGLTIGCGPHILACMDESEIGECFAIVKLESGE